MKKQTKPPAVDAPPGIKPEEIYAQYPRKVGRPVALKAIAKALKANPENVVMEATRKFAAVWAGASPEEMAYCPHPSTWFNQERFNDDPSTWRPKKNQNAAIGQLRLKKDALEKRIEQLANDTIYEMDKDYHAKCAELRECRAKLAKVQQEIINS